jgi:hypothetical protein
MIEKQKSASDFLLYRLMLLARPFCVDRTLKARSGFQAGACCRFPLFAFSFCKATLLARAAKALLSS